MGLFKFKNRNEKIGLLLGAICFAPSFFIAILLSLINAVLGIILLIINQYLWLKSIELCTRGLEEEIKKLKGDDNF